MESPGSNGMRFRIIKAMVSSESARDHRKRLARLVVWWKIRSGSVTIKQSLQRDRLSAKEEGDWREAFNCSRRTRDACGIWHCHFHPLDTSNNWITCAAVMTVRVVWWRLGLDPFRSIDRLLLRLSILCFSNPFHVLSNYFSFCSIGLVPVSDVAYYEHSTILLFS